MSILPPKQIRVHTMSVPELLAQWTSLQELRRRRTHQGDHLGEMLLVVEHPVLLCKEEMVGLDEIPHLYGQLNLYVSVTYRMSGCPDINFLIPFHSENDLWRAVDPGHDISSVLVAYPGFSEVRDHRIPGHTGIGRDM